MFSEHFFILLDADLVAGDGIYSRFITRYFGAGRYSFVVHVNDNSQVGRIASSHQSKKKIYFVSL